MGDDPNHRWQFTAVDHAGGRNSLCRLQTDHLTQPGCTGPRPDGRRGGDFVGLSDLIHSGQVARSVRRPSPPQRSRGAVGRRAARPRALPDRAAPYSISNRASNANCCRSVSATGWATWSGVRWARACSAADTQGRQTDTHRSGGMPSISTTSRKLDVVESSSHSPRCRPANDPPRDGFAIAHPGVTRDPRPRTWNSSTTCCRADVTLDDEVSRGSTRIAPPGTEPAPTSAYTPPAISSVGLRRRPSPSAPPHERRSTQFVLRPGSPRP